MAKSGNIDHQFGVGGKGYTLRMSWSETAVNTSANTSTVKIVAKLIAAKGYSISSTANKKIYITCDDKTVSGTCKVGISSGETKTLFTATFTVPHNANGTKTASLRCSLHIEVTLGGNYVSLVSGSGNAVLTAIARNPSAPTEFTITAGYGNYVGLGDTVNLSWSGASGAITGYELQYSRGNSGWKAWKTQTETSTTDSFTSTDINVNGAGCAVQYRVRSLNGSLTSDWKESNILTITGGMDLKVSNAWQTGSVWIKVNGTWQRAKRVWIKVNGTWQYSK